MKYFAVVFAAIVALSVASPVELEERQGGIFDMILNLVRGFICDNEIPVSDLDLYRACIISRRFCVNMFWNAMHIAQKVDHEFWIQEVYHLPLEPKLKSVHYSHNWRYVLRWQRHFAKKLRHKTANL